MSPSCGYDEPSADSFYVGFYNVENFFDTIDDPATDDDDFTPTGRQKWTMDRFETKRNRISEVIAAMELPDLMGLAEVENPEVLKSLISHEKLKSGNYSYVHRESPDHRGIDVALLYDTNKFDLVHTDIIRLEFPPYIEPDYTSRDILHVRLVFTNDAMNTPIEVFVNHWPSRRGGVEESEPKRLFVAQELKNYMNSNFTWYNNPYVLLMGDFNDEPMNNSIRDILEAKSPSAACEPGSLYTVYQPLQDRGEGSYNYRGNWDMVDQMILSGSFICGEGPIHFVEAQVFGPDWLTYNDPRFGRRPNRTYGGPNYYGGYSDHFPIRSTFQIAEK